MKPAILVPYRNRQSHLRAFLDRVPKYLEDVNGITEYVIYVAEQVSSDVFNLSLSRNVAAMCCLNDRKGVDYLIFHDVDIIPVRGIDYRSRDYNVAWFMSAGTCKIFVDAFVGANGYNPHFVGWGSEDCEFYDRLVCLNYEVKEWHRTDESKGAVMLNLEMPAISHTDADKWSRGYFGHSGEGPRYIPPTDKEHGVEVERYDKATFKIDKHEKDNNALRDRVYTMPRPEKLQYIGSNGMNLMCTSGISVKVRSEKIVWLTYESSNVLPKKYSHPRSS